jgi:hypothetical protein
MYDKTKTPRSADTLEARTHERTSCMSNLMLTHPRPVVNATRFVAKSEFEQGKHNYRHGLPLKSCSTDEMADGWLFCQEHGERHGWMRSTDARGADAYGRAMMAQASVQEAM